MFVRELKRNETQGDERVERLENAVFLWCRRMRENDNVGGVGYNRTACKWM